MGEVTLVTSTMPALSPMVRSPGVHVSTIIHSLATSMGHYVVSGEPANQAQLEAGTAFEYGLIHRLYDTHPGRFIQPGEMCVDNIHLNMDLFDLSDWCVDEFKVSSITVLHDPTVRVCPKCDGAPGPCRKFWKWWVQACAYCHAMGSVKARLRVLFERGDYKGQSGKQYREYVQVFSQDEVDRNWAVLVAHGHTLRCEECNGTGAGCGECDGTGVNVNNGGGR